MGNTNLDSNNPGNLSDKDRQILDKEREKNLATMLSILSYFSIDVYDGNQTELMYDMEATEKWANDHLYLMI